MNNKTQIALNLRKFMVSNDLKPRDVKRAFNDLGLSISNSALSNYLSLDERNVRIPNHRTVLAFAKAFGVKFGDIYGAGYVLHDDDVENLTRCGDIAFSPRFNLSNNVEHYIVTDSSNKPFKIGDCLVIDRNDTNVTSGYYAIVINHITQVRKMFSDGNEYTVNFGIDSKTMEFNSVRIIGRISARFTTFI